MQEQALSDLKVLDFGWVAAVPILTLQLSLHGADVVRVESSARPDASRATGPFIDETRTVSAAFGQLNANKRSIGINLKSFEGRELVLDLVRWADVITENFRPGTLAKLGLGFDDLAEHNPQIVMLQSSSAGQTGPLSTVAATGDLLQSLCGFTHLTGGPTDKPMPPWGAWTDITVPAVGVASILASVRQARKTGQGQLLDMSQMELSMAFLADQLVASQIESDEPMRQGNHDERYTPHGVFPVIPQAHQPDAWVAISVTDDNQWLRLADILGRSEWSTTLATAAARRDKQHDIAQAIEAWTSVRSADQVVVELRDVGIACSEVLDSQQVMDDQQLASRNYFQYTDHPAVGDVLSPAAAYVLSETPAQASTVAPEIGEHTWQITTELLGRTDEEAALLMAAEAIE